MDRKHLAVILPLASILLYQGDVLRDLLLRWWDDPNYSHGFFVPLFSLYFLHQNRSQLAATPWHGSVTGLPIILLAAAVKSVSHLLLSPYLAGISLIISLAGVVVLCWGWRMMRRVWVPVAFLLLMLPLPQPLYETLSLPLQQFAAVFSASVLQNVGIPVLREGNVIHFAGKSLEVAQACSGMRLLVGFIAMGIAVAHLSHRPHWQKAFIMISTFPIAIVANAVRVTGTGILYHSVSERLAEGFFHAFSGWLLFVIALGVLALECHILAKLITPRNGGAAT